MTGEGYIKFRLEHTPGVPLPEPSLKSLFHWRERLFDLGLIGVYPDGIGYGNLSQRIPGTDQFIISGTATGGLTELQADHFTTVTHFDPQVNTVWCEGPIHASSESMSHGIIYRLLAEVGAVIHVHHSGLWKKLLAERPSTPESVTYGSPEMAFAIETLVREAGLETSGIFAMAGHEEGVMSFGRDLEEAGKSILEYMSDEYMSDEYMSDEYMNT